MVFFFLCTIEFDFSEKVLLLEKQRKYARTTTNSNHLFRIFQLNPEFNSSRSKSDLCFRYYLH
ncbi:hypothetical protein LEP1GSC103_2160 [Leptospira borgpetersenii serovar Javanica str. UI 09931]|uniref:Uncharacterized protein n=5 Tax=Leptospira borgpetersenii TaxID=174 RepID=M3F8N6_LEPBO|nr:hypothetical protein LBBP_03666 [Leptospira borgpetersenii serovar Ballum]AXX16750.1 hypothetical protein C4Q31_15535 [Leptospira borgpetersenii serovar Ceylonica]EKP13385.1 hypothetical protein LEP1GSC128_3996 [Leptospira borgpetersenii str. 200801926]EKQ93714.1 hypothetical protein LEP1GSC101_1664 [Leptospira borgpetersenii str. UI 09149]EKR00330.1 hypothetical protein LEP1GSC121_3677 [Leptospira borgpetersenii serovar Castellonis str. 200801910]EMF98282.1 hypothetical protein LEP1GSC123_